MASATPDLGGQSFNVASGAGTTVKQAFEIVANQVERILGQAVAISFIEWPPSVASIEFRNFTANITKYTKATGWNPTVNLKEGIATMITELTKRGYKHDE